MNKLYALLLIVTLSNAQQLKFEDILDLTIKNNKDLKLQKSNIELSKLNISNIDASSYGKLSFEEQINRTNHSGYVFNSKLSSREASFNDFGFSQMNEGLLTQPEELNNPKARNNFNTKLNYDIPLFTGFKLSNQKDILKLQKKAQILKYKLNEKQLFFEVLKSYNAAVVAKEFINASKKAKEAIVQVVKSANAFYKEGLVTKIDVKQAKVYEFNINSKIIQSQNKFDLAIAYLKFLTSSDKITDVKSLKNIEFQEKPTDELYSIALNNRDDLQMQNLSKDANKKSIELSNSAYYPLIYSHLEYGFNDDKLTLDTDKDYYNALIGLKYTLFDNTRNINYEKSKIQYQKATLNYEKLKDYIKLQIEKSTLDANAKQKVLKEKNEALNLANDVYSQAQLLYKNQLISMTNLLEQEANLRNNEALLILAKYEYSLSLANQYLVLGNTFKTNETILKVIK
jgi:outer membrane protein TolC